MILRHTHWLEKGIFGKLFDDHGQPVCVTLEHAFPGGPKGWRPAIPCNTYLCQRSVHILAPTKDVPAPKEFETFQVMNVPGHTEILFHKGNFNEDSSGCILLGMRLYLPEHPIAIASSREAFDMFMKSLEGRSNFGLWVTDDPSIPEEPS